VAGEETMSYQHPIYTEKTECQDCSRCVRNCPVKAIRVENGSAVVVPELCIACGTCVQVCPVGAKHVRDDLGRVRQLLRAGDRVFVSLAPSFTTEFGDAAPEALIQALLDLGFAGVSETALGAQEVSATVAELMGNADAPRIYLSSACPTVVGLVHKYMPAHAGAVTDLCSPLLAHSRLLRKEFGADIRVVFIGPCVAKKQEADRFPELLDLAISFADLRAWLKAEGVDLHRVRSGDGATFVPYQAQEGALYPVDGGMIAGIRANCGVCDAEFMSFSGVENVRSALTGLDEGELTAPLFLELLACEGGCVNGPCSASRTGTVLKRRQVSLYASYPGDEIPRTPLVDARLDRRVAVVDEREFSEGRIREALLAVGKRGPEDELNCAGCGYADCRAFALALLRGKAEPAMCVSYMRKLAQKKANALIRTMPSGVVIVDADLRVVECNRHFAEMLGRETVMIYEAQPGLEGALLGRVAPHLTPLFQHVLNSGEDIPGKDIRRREGIHHLTIFTIDPHRIVGGVFQDITRPSVRKEKVIEKAREVIHKQLSTVQQIAYLLGENAAESQVSLNAIIESF
jgi:iron only hydrogenase large subunit-like protein